MIEEQLDENEHEELFEHFRLEIDKGQAITRIDKFLTNRLENTSRNRVQNAADAGTILVNDKPVKSNYKVKPGDIVSIVLSHPPREIELIAQDIPIDIVYEDDDIVVINKSNDMVVHPSYGHYDSTLVNALMFHFQNLPSLKADYPRPGLVHRIDMHTSGLLVIAKNEISMTKLSKEFFDHTIERKYNALVWGSIVEDEGTITGHVGRSIRNRKVMDVFPDGSMGKHAVTHYKVLERFSYVTLVECKLETGRTHQIRAHFQHIGHPLFNDDWYGGNKILKGTTFTKYRQFVENCFELLPSQALHAKSLGFTHPKTGEQLHFDSELPKNFQILLERWRNYVA